VSQGNAPTSRSYSIGRVIPTSEPIPECLENHILLILAELVPCVSNNIDTVRLSLDLGLGTRDAVEYSFSFLFFF